MNFRKQTALLLVPLFSVAFGLNAAEKPVAASATAPVAKRAEVLPLLNFGALPKVFAFGSWNNNVSASKEGLAVFNTANGKGGLGADTQLSLEDAKYLELQLTIGALNQVPQVQVLFEDDNGTAVIWAVPIGLIVPGQTLWFRVPIDSLQLIRPGTDNVMNVAKIMKWRFQGDNKTERPVHVRVISLVARR